MKKIPRKMCPLELFEISRFKFDAILPEVWSNFSVSQHDNLFEIFNYNANMTKNSGLNSVYRYL